MVKKYAVGHINGTRVFRFKTLRGAENQIERFKKIDAEGVARGDYYIDGPPQTGSIELPKGKTANERAKERAEAAIMVKMCAASPTGPIVTVEGGVVQDVFILDASAKDGYRSLSYTLIDYDIFESDTAEEIAERWVGWPPQLKAYFEKRLPHEYGLFMEAIAETAKTVKE